MIIDSIDVFLPTNGSASVYRTVAAPEDLPQGLPPPVREKRRLTGASLDPLRVMESNPLNQHHPIRTPE